jgi:hypothetical protein
VCLSFSSTSFAVSPQIQIISTVFILLLKCRMYIILYIFAKRWLYSKTCCANFEVEFFKPLSIDTRYHSSKFNNAWTGYHRVRIYKTSITNSYIQSRLSINLPALPYCNLRHSYNQSPNETILNCVSYYS